MSVLDFFNRKPNNEEGSSFNEEVREVSQEPVGNKIAVFYPKSYADVEKVIDDLKLGKQVIVHLENLKSTTQIRVLDLLSGAIYALNGGLNELQKGIYLFSPNGIDENN